MNNFKYSLSVRVSGSDQELKTWRGLYLIEPCRLRKNSEGEIHYMLFQHAKKSHFESPLESEIELALNKIGDTLKKFRKTFETIKIIISIGIFCDEYCGFIVSPLIANKIFLCNCDIDVNIYPPDKEN